MHYYLYPKGGNSQYCAWILEHLRGAKYFQNGIYEEGGGGEKTYFFLVCC